jgi:hypothetical protein
MLLHPACLEVGPRYFEMRTLKFYHGQIMLLPRNEELWVRAQAGGVQMLEMTLSDAAVSTAWNGMRGEVALFSLYEVVDPRIHALERRERGKGCRLSERRSVSGFRRRRPCRGACGFLRNNAPDCTYVWRRTWSRTPAQDQRVGTREIGKQIASTRNGESSWVEHSSFLADVSSVHRGESSSVCPAPPDRACEGDAAS